MHIMKPFLVYMIVQLRENLEGEKKKKEQLIYRAPHPLPILRGAPERDC